MQVRMNKRFYKFVPDLIAHVAQEDDIAGSDVKDLAEISNLDDADSAEKIETVVEKMRKVEDVADVVLSLVRGGIWVTWVSSVLLNKWLSSCELQGG
ncbi:hypothetical protein BTUL_0033g00230 [Botrytis tulipae]|uniref:Uncharacterized protein n=1 Tax=Botrytis tulipae TaxID=87230 RepID=A0A4Z1EUT9_9HELO|nr:hypothetical protein BTUL_0033g00230 [Botrytis tulipae]